MAASPFRPATDLLVQYATYHRDPRNIASHWVGIPLIVLAIGVLLAGGSLGGINLAWIAWALLSLWYLTRGKRVLGLATCLVNAVPLAAGWDRPLAADIERRAGPVQRRGRGASAA